MIFTFSVFHTCTYNNEIIDALAEQEEFVFATDDISDYKSWTVVGNVTRNDVGQYRTVYINKSEEATRTSGRYPVGTIIVKELADINNRDKVIILQVMSKRGSDFNPLGNGWEWAISRGPQPSELNNNRGDNAITLFDGQPCISCHTDKNFNDLTIQQYD